MVASHAIKGLANFRECFCVHAFLFKLGEERREFRLKKKGNFAVDKLQMQKCGALFIPYSHEVYLWLFQLTQLALNKHFFVAF